VYMVHELHILIVVTLNGAGWGLRGRHGGDVTYNVQYKYKPNQNCHSESPPSPSVMNVS
jgi:hypothetical protein